MAQNLAKFSDIVTAIEVEVDGAATTHAVTIGLFVNRIYRKCLSKILQLNRDYFLTSATFSTTVDQKMYVWATLLITDILLPVAIVDGNGDFLRVGSVRKNIEEIFWTGNSGFGFATAPGSVETYTLWYIARKADLSGTDVPVIEQIHFDLLYWGACYLFFIWKKNKELAAFYKTFYDEAWEDFVNYHTTRVSDDDRVTMEDDGLN